MTAHEFRVAPVARVEATPESERTQADGYTVDGMSYENFQDVQRVCGLHCPDCGAPVYDVTLDNGKHMIQCREPAHDQCRADFQPIAKTRGAAFDAFVRKCERFGYTATLLEWAGNARRRAMRDREQQGNRAKPSQGEMFA